MHFLMSLFLLSLFAQASDFQTLSVRLEPLKSCDASKTSVAKKFENFTGKLVYFAECREYSSHHIVALTYIAEKAVPFESISFSNFGGSHPNLETCVEDLDYQVKLFQKETSRIVLGAYCIGTAVVHAKFDVVGEKTARNLRRLSVTIPPSSDPRYINALTTVLEGFGATVAGVYRREVFYYFESPLWDDIRTMKIGFAVDEIRCDQIKAQAEKLVQDSGTEVLASFCANVTKNWRYAGFITKSGLNHWTEYSPDKFETLEECQNEKTRIRKVYETLGRPTLGGICVRPMTLSKFQLWVIGMN